MFRIKRPIFRHCFSALSEKLSLCRCSVRWIFAKRCDCPSRARGSVRRRLRNINGSVEIWINILNECLPRCNRGCLSPWLQSRLHKQVSSFQRPGGADLRDGRLRLFGRRGWKLAPDLCEGFLTGFSYIQPPRCIAVFANMALKAMLD